MTNILEKPNVSEWAHPSSGDTRSSKKAAAHEQLQKKIEAYTVIIKGMVRQVNAYPLSYDYPGELQKLYDSNPQDSGAIAAAEKEAHAKSI